MAGPLEGLTVLDLTRVLSGPYCTMLLADMGARVVKIEQPGRGDETRAWGPPFIAGETTYFLAINRNKESVTLDFKSDDGRAILERLIDRADVLVENFRPGTLARLGLEADAVRARRPRLVYCSLSGFGHTGPRRTQAGYDAVIQAEGGLMSLTGEPGGALLRSGVPIADLVTGLLAVQGVLLALFARERTGHGQHVDISMFDGVVSLLSYHASAYLNASAPPARLGNRHPNVSPYDTFPAADGELFLAIGNDEQFRRFCAAAKLDALASDPRFATNPARVTNQTALYDEMAGALRQRPRAHWVSTLRDAGIPCGEVRDVPEVLADPQIVARRMLETLPHATAGLVKVLGVPITLSGTPGTVRTAPPTLGQHTDAVLRELGIDEASIRSLRTRKVI